MVDSEPHCGTLAVALHRDRRMIASRLGLATLKLEAQAPSVTVTLSGPRILLVTPGQ